MKATSLKPKVRLDYWAVRATTKRTRKKSSFFMQHQVFSSYHISHHDHNHHPLPPPNHHLPPSPLLRNTTRSPENQLCQRHKFIISISTSISALTLSTLSKNTSNVALAESWGTRSFIKERFFEPGLSAEDAVARIRQTREGLHSIRNMLETMSWRYVLFYIRLKSEYLSQDLKNAMSIVPESSKSWYVKAANELVDNMSVFDYYVRTPKVYESYLYYEKTLQSIDDLVAVLA